jgi:multidrug transporter EmrE-like cation transporter
MLKKNVITAIIFLIMAILCRSLAFVFAKYAAFESIGDGLAGIIINIFYWAEILALGLQMLFWIQVLKRLRLSLAYSAMSSVYGINLAWAWYLFDENVSINHIVGCIIIIAGIILASFTSKTQPV